MDDDSSVNRDSPLKVIPISDASLKTQTPAEAGEFVPNLLVHMRIPTIMLVQMTVLPPWP
jgi:hypothetical protein